MITDLESWLNQSFSREATGQYDDIKLGPISQVLAALPAPPRPVTIAGTKGKGSTLAMLEGALLSAGARTIAFTSPHVFSVHERWRINGNDVDEATAVAAAQQVADAEEATGAALTYFERCFAIAVVLAADRGDAHFLVEVGLGGRLDCANALDTRMAIITHLSRDHCAILGDTVALIAREKLAIARHDAPLLIAPQSLVGTEAVHVSLPLAASCHWVETGVFPAQQPLAMPGEHQRQNAATALTAARMLLPTVDDDILIAGIARARMPARSQLIEQTDRTLLIDGAHNGPSIQAAVAVADTHLRSGWQLILGLATDKELAEILPLIPTHVQVVRCGYEGPRARRADAWPDAPDSWPYHDRIDEALAATDPHRDVCITGSFYLAGEALRLLEGQSNP